jgi:hypothetical protein
MTVAAESFANVLWFLPTHGDGHHLGTTIGALAHRQKLRRLLGDCIRACAVDGKAAIPCRGPPGVAVADVGSADDGNA